MTPTELADSIFEQMENNLTANGIEEFSSRLSANIQNGLSAVIQEQIATAIIELSMSLPCKRHPSST